jgi:hypothetical protein
MLPAAMALVVGLVVIGCKNATAVEGDVGIVGGVGINVGQAPQVAAVTVVKTENGQYYIVSWEAVAEDLSYSLYFVQDGKKSNVQGPSYPDSIPQNTYKYSSTNGNQSANEDLDKWSVRIDTSRISSLTVTPGSFKFGVRTKRNNASDVTEIVSDIKWSDNITLTAGPVVSGVTLAKETEEPKFKVTFTKPTPPTDVTYQYSVEILREGISYPVGNDTATSPAAGEEIVSDISVSFWSSGKLTAKVQITGATNAAGPVYDISKVQGEAVSSVLTVGATW